MLQVLQSNALYPLTSQNFDRVAYLKEKKRIFLLFWRLHEVDRTNVLIVVMVTTPQRIVSPWAIYCQMSIISAKKRKKWHKKFCLAEIFSTSLPWPKIGFFNLFSQTRWTDFTEWLSLVIFLDLFDCVDIQLSNGKQKQAWG